MKCGKCYPAQIFECIEKIKIYCTIDIEDDTAIKIKITDSLGNVFVIDNRYYVDSRMDIALELLPKNLFNRYSGAIKIEIYDEFLQTQLQMSFCDNLTMYDCIVIDKIEMNNDVANITTSTIGCAP